MIWVVLALFIVLVLAAAVVGLVAVPARREGRMVLTERGEEFSRNAAGVLGRRREKLTARN